jgi:ATP-dependent RNA helicase DDX3X
MAPTPSIVFTNSKVKCDMLDDFLYNRGLPDTSIHSDLADVTVV